MKYKQQSEGESLLQNKSYLNNEYDTFLDMYTRGDKVILVTDKDNLKIFRDGIQSKLQIATAGFVLFLICQLLLHVYLSFHNLRDCENKINSLQQTTKMTEATKDITYICASYVMHIFLIIGYFIIAFITTYKQSRILFQVLEIYIIIMFISDLFFSFINP